MKPQQVLVRQASESESQVDKEKERGDPRRGALRWLSDCLFAVGGVALEAARHELAPAPAMVEIWLHLCHVFWRAC